MQRLKSQILKVIFLVIRQILFQAGTARSEQIITANAACILFSFSLSMFFIQINFYHFLFKKKVLQK